ncbi:branched-chain amino acid ABC transporter permease [Steroidobacter agaridevorans]|nr:urea ABC transporter permease subunit UrtB [Steroidobacter agaridevorans]GFE87018.1 branched-chain amino acid ABC transporter permease [Steroidobacter agaridevorans]
MTNISCTLFAVPGASPGPLFLARRALGWLALLLVVGMLARPAAAAESTSFEQALGHLATANFKQKERAVGELLDARHANTRAVLNALLEGTLYYRKDDRRVFIAAAQDASLRLLDPLTMSDAGTAEASDYTKITTNNQLRKTLKSALASFDLADPDANVRLAAVNELMRSLDADSVSILRARQSSEKNDAVRTAISTGLAIADLDSADAAVRLAAVEQLEGSLNPEAFNRLSALVTKADDGSYAEPDENVRNAARAALNEIDNWRSFYRTLETLFFGLSLGSVLVLAAIGLAITFGVMGVINMAHGELMMLGAYTTYVIQLLMPQHIGASVLVAIPVAFLVAGGVGVLIERGIMRFLYGRPLETLLATFGVSLVLQQIVRDIFTANNRPVETPAWMAGSLQINEAFSITYNRLYVVLFMLIVFAILQLVLKKTSLGLKVRAVAQNRAMAKSMGVRTEWVDALTFGLGSGIAGVAGVALSQLTNVGPNLGQSYIIDSFMVVVFGGVGNLWGTLIGGMSLGVVNQALEPYAGAVLAKILVLIALILFIQRRPRGLFPQKGRAAEN